MISITVDSFKDNFLTCATCFCHFNQDVRKAKLLPCSHTVCLPCLRRMEEHSGDKSLNCPSCRQTFNLPQDGSVDDLPPAFLINNLCELVEKGTKVAAPFCSEHTDSRTLYCETCDEAFCESCNSTQSPADTSVLQLSRCREHAVVPVNAAMSKLHRSVLDQVQQCQTALAMAKKSIEQVRRDLSASSERVVADINKEFDVLRKHLENRRLNLIGQVEAVKSAKERKLVNQLNTIESERSLVTDVAEDLAKLQRMSSTMKSLTERYNDVLRLCEPEENSYIHYTRTGTQTTRDIVNKLSRVGNISVSTTFPGNSLIKQQTHRVLTHIENEFLIETFEIDDRRRTTGGDPISVVWTDLSQENIDKLNPGPDPVESSIKDCLNGTYLLKSRIKKSGTYLLDVSIFGRPIKNSPLTVRVESNHLPQWKISLPDVGNPLKVFQDQNEEIYVLDEAKELIHVYNCDGTILKNITLPIRGGATVGMAMVPGKEEMFCLNWRQNAVCKFLKNGTFLQSMAFTDLECPTDIVIDDALGRLLVADPQSSKIFVFNSDFTPQFNFRIGPERGVVMCVQAGLDGEILVGTSLALLCYNSNGVYQRNVTLSPTVNAVVSASNPVRLSVPCCVVCPTTRSIVAVVTETLQKEKNKTRSYIAVLDCAGPLRFCIATGRPVSLVRPNGLCIGQGRYAGHVLLVDIHTKSLSAYKFH
uniref:RING-type domain-containing protein n=1 Tax=Steinernema glaseri TaxID=37863 RepID=A0A1I7YIM8_9BILA